MLDRRKKNVPVEGKDRRNNPKVGPFHLLKGSKRYQFNGIIVHFNSEFNIWYVVKSSEPDWKNILFEVTGIENEKEAIHWARKYIENIKVK